MFYPRSVSSQSLCLQMLMASSCWPSWPSEILVAGAWRFSHSSAMLPDFVGPVRPELLLKEPLSSGTRKSKQSSHSYRKGRTIWLPPATGDLASWVLPLQVGCSVLLLFFSQGFLLRQDRKSLHQDLSTYSLWSARTCVWSLPGSFSFVCLFSFLSSFL